METEPRVAVYDRINNQPLMAAELERIRLAGKAVVLFAEECKE